MNHNMDIILKTLIDGAISMSEVAYYVKEQHAINTGRNRIYRLLRDAKLLNAANLPVGKYVHEKYFKVIAADKEHIDLKIDKTLAYQKGVDLIVKLLVKYPRYTTVPKQSKKSVH
jgi:hypothetical protein